MSLRRLVAALGPARNRPAFFWIALLLGVGFMGLYICSVWAILRHGAEDKDFGWTDAQRDGAWVVMAAEPHGPAAGKLEPGDRLLAFNGDARAARIGPDVFEHFLAPGSAYSLRVRRNSRDLEVALRPQLTRVPRLLLESLAYLVVSLSFFGVGVLLGLLSPEDRVTQLGCLTCVAVAVQLLSFALPYGVGGRFENTLVHGAEIQDPWHLMLAFQFFFCFSANLLHERVWSILRNVIYAIGLVFFVPNAPLQLLYIFGQESIAGFAYRHPSFWGFHRDLYHGFRNEFDLFALIAMCAAVAASYARVRDPDHRRRVRWVVFGSVAGLSPLLLYQAAELILKLTGQESIYHIWPGGILVVNFALVIIPYSTGYAIVKHRALGISVVIRQSVKYLLARNVLQAILLLPVMGLILPVVRNPNRTVSELFLQNSIYLNLLLLGALSVGLKYRLQLRTWVDRKFFREAYNQEKILRELIGKIRELDSISEISSLVSHEVETALHPRRLSVFYREKEKSDLMLGYSSGGGSSDLRIAETSHILQVMEDSRGPLDYPLPRGFNLPGPEKEWLERLDTHLIVPITGSRQKLAGVILLGEKRSEEPYTPTDRNLLEAIAAQMGIVHERAWFKEQVGEEQRIKREVLAHLAQTDVHLLKECPRCGACFDSTTRTCDRDGAELTLTLPVERTIDGKYRLDQRIGQGAMGAVYEATDLRLNRRIAVKVMVGSLFGNRQALRRFEREARASALLNHPNIVAIYDFGMIGQDGAYLVMERVYGTTWRAELKTRRTLAPAVAADWFNQLLNGLNAAHEAGVVHRDLKPENVLVTRRDNQAELIKVLDFGLAKMRQFEGMETQSLTMAGGVVGTVGYISPEELGGGEADQRSDIFAVGVMVVEAISGRRPFEGRNHAETLTAILTRPFELPGKTPEVKALNAVLAKCLAKNPADRFDSVAEMQNGLVSALKACPETIGSESRGRPGGDIPTRSIGA